MTMDISTTLFLCSFGVGVIAWFFGVAEAISTNKFLPWTYKIGTKVINEEKCVSWPLNLPESTIKLKYAKVKILSSNTLYFKPHIKLFDFRLNTILPIKGTIVWNNKKAKVVGRIPLAIQVFLTAWLFGWTIGGFSFFDKESTTEQLEFIAFGWLFVVIPIAISLPVEIKRARKTVEEINAELRNEST